MDAQTLARRISSVCSLADRNILLEDIAKITRSNVILNDVKISPDIVAKIEDILTQHKDGTPISRILGYREFYGLKFSLNDHTLDPRPETELIVDLALKYAAGKSDLRILDLGSGTGCIPISILKNLPKGSALATAADISREALSAAESNAQLNGVRDSLDLCCSNWFENITGQFDIITSNPPYIDTNVVPNLDENVRTFDPILALDGGKDGLEPYKIMFAALKKHLKPQGRAFFEIGYDQCGQIERLAENARIRIVAIHPDSAGIPRVVEISCGDK